MSNLLPGNGVRDKYVKDSGNNDNDGAVVDAGANIYYTRNN